MPAIPKQVLDNMLACKQAEKKEAQHQFAMKEAGEHQKECEAAEMLVNTL